MGVSTATGLLDHVVGYTIEKSYLGPVLGLLGEAKNPAGEE
tara:strand:- start:32 stop:154 length:123 start_codon:yes stop_codon:yes gene_type:complete